jgi:hypothetical protein
MSKMTKQEQDKMESDLITKMLLEASTMRDSEDWHRDNNIALSEAVTESLKIDGKVVNIDDYR